jgi:hypothetical protein
LYENTPLINYISDITFFTLGLLDTESSRFPLKVVQDGLGTVISFPCEFSCFDAIFSSLQPKT